jgi:fatty acid desaturase
MGGRMIVRLLITAAFLAALGYGWHIALVPTWIAALVALSTLIWGFDLDWRRKKREAEQKGDRTRRQLRRTEREDSERTVRKNRSERDQ